MNNSIHEDISGEPTVPIPKSSSSSAVPKLNLSQKSPSPSSTKPNISVSSLSQSMKNRRRASSVGGVVLSQSVERLSKLRNGKDESPPMTPPLHPSTPTASASFLRKSLSGLLSGRSRSRSQPSLVSVERCASGYVHRVGILHSANGSEKYMSSVTESQFCCTDVENLKGDTLVVDLSTVYGVTPNTPLNREALLESGVELSQDYSARERGEVVHSGEDCIFTIHLMDRLSTTPQSCLSFVAPTPMDRDLWVLAIRTALLSGLRKQTDSVSSLIAKRHAKFLVLLNPACGDGSSSVGSFTVVRDMFERANIETETILSQRKGHVQSVCQSTDISSLDGIVVVGGDGTLHEVVNGLMTRKDWVRAISVPIGIIPCGSTNGFATSLGLRSVAMAAFTCIKGKKHPVDVVSVLHEHRRLYSIVGIRLPTDEPLGARIEYLPAECFPHTEGWRRADPCSGMGCPVCFHRVKDRSQIYAKYDAPPVPLLQKRQKHWKIMMGHYHTFVIGNVTHPTGGHMHGSKRAAGRCLGGAGADLSRAHFSDGGIDMMLSERFSLSVTKKGLHDGNKNMAKDIVYRKCNSIFLYLSGRADDRTASPDPIRQATIAEVGRESSIASLRRLSTSFTLENISDMMLDPSDDDSEGSPNKTHSLQSALVLVDGEPLEIGYLPLKITVHRALARCFIWRSV